jgi:predicted permease
LSQLITLFSANILPILLITGVGYLLQKSLTINPVHISRLIFYAFTPALVFTLLLESEFDALDLVRMTVFVLVIVVTIAAAAWLIGRALRLDRASNAGFILAAAFMNAGNYGLSLNQFAFGVDGLAWASLFFVFSAMLTNSLGVFIASTGRRRASSALIGLVRVPAIYAILLAFILRITGVTVPLPVSRAVGILSDGAIPAMLVMLGMQIAHAGIPRRKDLLTGVIALRLVISPALAYLLAPALGMTGISIKAGVLEAAMPTAVLTTVIATEFDVEPDFVTGAVLATTLLSPITLTPILAILNP